MVAEGVIALIWAAAAMAFFRVDTPEGWAALSDIGGNSASVKQISEGVLGPVGTVLAIIGVVICPITSGDTALRSCRLIVGEAIHLDQKKLKNRLILTLPLFVLVIGLSLWNFMNEENFNVLWRWFAWSNQVLASIALWVATAYLLKKRPKRWISLITGIPAILLTMVVATYIFAEPRIALGRWIPYMWACLIGAGLTLIPAGFYLYFLFRKKPLYVEETPAEEKEETPEAAN